MSNHSVIEHRASYHFIKLEEDYLAICSKGKTSPHCKAFILSIIEHWMNTKRSRGEGDYAYLTMPEWIKHMYMLYERNVVESCIKELLEEGLIIRRPIKRHGQKTFEYTLNVDAIHAMIKALPIKEANDTLPNLDNYLAHRERSKAEKREVREKSRTASEKSRTLEDSEKSHRVREKSRTSSTGRYVKNHSNIDSITKIITEIESTNDEPDVESPTSDSLIHPSIPSLSLVDNQASSEQDDTPHHIANPTTIKPIEHLENNPTIENVESLTTGNTSFGPITEPLDPSKRADMLNPEEKRVFDLLCEVFYAIPPEVITEKIKKQCAALAPHVRNSEDLKSLRDYTRAQIVDDPSYKKKQAHLGNLVSFVNGWKQEREPLPDKPQDKPKVRKLTYEEKMAQPL